MTPAEFDHQLATDIGRFYADPLGYVLYAFDWGEGDLADWTGPDEWQTEFLTSLGEAIRTREPGDVIKMAVKSGRGPGKSALIAWLCLWLMSTRPQFSGVVTANTGTQLDGKTWRELALWKNRAINGHWFDWTATKLVQVDHPETWKIVAEKWSEHKPDAFGGLHNGGRGQCVIMDEGSGIPAPIYDVTDATMTDPDAFVFVFGNPMRKSGRFYELFTKLRHRWRTMTVDTRRAKAANQKQIRDAIEDWGMDSDYVRVNVLGEFPKADVDTLIALELLEGAKARQTQGTERFRPIWGVDPARFGDDRSTLGKRRQRKLMEPIKAWRSLDTMQLVGRLVAEYEDCSIDDRPSHIVVDVIGIGAGVVDRLRELKREGGFPDTTIMALNVAESPSVDGRYAKLRDELWWKMREWFEARDCQCVDEALAAELSDVLYGFTSNGLIKLESKQETKERLGRSPDLADALMHTFAVPPLPMKARVETDRYRRARARSGGASAWAA